MPTLDNLNASLKDGAIGKIDSAALLKEINQLETSFRGNETGSAAAAADVGHAALEANVKFIEELSGAMQKLAKGEGGKVEIGGFVIEDISSISGIAAFTQAVSVVQANLELVNNVLSFIKQFEKQIQGIQSS